MIVTIDMTRAREIKRDHIRAEREPLLAAADAEYMRADEAGDADVKAAVAARKQALRDAPAAAAIEAAATPAALAAITLEDLL